MDSSSFVLTEMHYVTIYINSSSQKLHILLRNRTSSSRILSMARPSLEAGLMRWVNLRKAGAKLYCIVSVWPVAVVVVLRRVISVVDQIFISLGSASIGPTSSPQGKTIYCQGSSPHPRV